jgi:hypothetical protein
MEWDLVIMIKLSRASNLIMIWNFSDELTW